MSYTATNISITEDGLTTVTGINLEFVFKVDDIINSAMKKGAKAAKHLFAEQFEDYAPNDDDKADFNKSVKKYASKVMERLMAYNRNIENALNISISEDVESIQMKFVQHPNADRNAFQLCEYLIEEVLYNNAVADHFRDLKAHEVENSFRVDANDSLDMLKFNFDRRTGKIRRKVSVF